MASVALLSNPQVDRQPVAAAARARLLRASIRTSSITRSRTSARSARALRTIARVKPKVLVINGGDGTVQAALTELLPWRPFRRQTPPPVAVLPNGKTNLIAHDLGAAGDPIEALERVLASGPHRHGPAHRLARADRAVRRRGAARRRAAGARHVPRRRGPCRHDPLLPAQNLSARPAQLGGARADLPARAWSR